MVGIFKELLSRSDSSGSKSTVLKPLTWFISIIIGGILLLVYVDGPQWLIIFFSIIISIVILLFLFAYLYCLFNNPDSLRSERFFIQKMAIERGVYGDNTVGIINEKKFNKEKTISESEDKGI